MNLLTTLAALFIIFLIGWCGAYAAMLGEFKRAEPIIALVALLLLTAGLVSLETGRHASAVADEDHQAAMASHWAYVAWPRADVGCHPFPKVRELMANHLHKSRSSFPPYWGNRHCPAIETEAAQRTVAMLDAAFLKARAAQTQASPLYPGEVWRALLPAGLGLLGGLATVRLLRPRSRV